jgi:Protein of unknown function (DUF2490)
MQSRAERSERIAFRVILVVIVALGAHGARAQEVIDDGRVGAIFAHPIAGEFSGAPYVWFDDQTGGVKTYRVSIPDVIYKARPWLQGLSGFIVNWTDGQASGNTRELRPYVGVKVFVPNTAHIHVYDLTRLEWRRITNTASDAITREKRFRTRPGVEFPLSTHAWEPRTFYGLANGELFVEHRFVNAVRFASGAGYIKSDRLRIEFQYVLELSRKASTDALAYSDNSFRLDFKFSFKHGLLVRQDGPD